MKEIHIYILFILPVYSEFAHRFVPFLLYRIIKMLTVSVLWEKAIAEMGYILKETALCYFKVLREHLVGVTEESATRYNITGLRSSASQIRGRNVKRVTLRREMT